MRPVEIIRKPVEPHGSVIQDCSKIETLAFDSPKHKASVEVELAQHDDGLWMWGISCTVGFSYRGYRVGPKWGQFAQTRQDAIVAACNEIELRGPPAEVMHWLDRLAGPQQMELFV